MTPMPDVYVPGTAGGPAVAAQRDFVARGDELQAELGAKVALTTGLQLSPRDWDTACEDLIHFCQQRLLRHLSVTDRVLYSAAAGAAESRLLVEGLRTQHRLLAQHVAELERAGNRDQVGETAHALVALVAGCFEVERAVLLPAVATSPRTDLPSLVAEATTLDRSGELDVPERLDLREIPHAQRHPRILGVYARLRLGESLVLVNNRDPKPLRRAFDAAYPGRFGWEYLQSGPEIWQIRISRNSRAT